MLCKRSSFVFRVFLSSLLIFLLSSCQNGQPDKKDDRKSQKQVNRVKNYPSGDFPEIIVTDGESRNLGAVKEGIKTHVIFMLKNIGKARATDISVHDLSKGGCTAVSKISELAAGDSAKLEFIFETLGYGGKEQLRQVKVRYNNPELSPITLSVVADVLPTEAHQVPIGELFYNFFVMVDVREEQKFREGHIVGAIPVPADELVDWASQLPETFMIYLYSDDGELSDRCAKILREKGYSRALSIVGGLAEWKDQYGERFIITGRK